MLVLTRGFFFYQTVLRQDLVGKLPSASVFDLPRPHGVRVLFSQAFERGVKIVLFRLFRWWLLLEWLSGVGGSSSTYQHVVGGFVEEEPGVVLRADIRTAVGVTNFFALVFFVWYQGYHTATEIYSLRCGYVSRPYWGDCDLEDRGVLEYLAHKPLRQGLDKLGRSVLTVFKQSSFMTAFPVDVRVWGGFTVLINFSGIGNTFNQAALSAFRFQQRMTIDTDALLNA